MTKAIKQAAKNCRAAWKAAPNAKWAWCCHHGVELELLTEPPENRIRCILLCKPESEQVTRLNNFRPGLSQLPKDLQKTMEAYSKAWKAYSKAKEARDKSKIARLHKLDVPNHTWNGKDIFWVSW